MDVTSTSQMQQQMHIRKMNGAGSAQGRGGMSDIMQNLSNEDKNSLIEQLSSMDKEQRMQKVAEMKELDASSMSAQDYTKALFDILDKKSTDEIQTDTFSVYA